MRKARYSSPPSKEEWSALHTESSLLHVSLAMLRFGSSGFVVIVVVVSVDIFVVLFCVVVGIISQC